MIITRFCAVVGQVVSMDIPKLTPELFAKGELARSEGALIQNVYPFLTPDEREFLITGITPEIWDEVFGKGE